MSSISHAMRLLAILGLLLIGTSCASANTDGFGDPSVLRQLLQRNKPKTATATSGSTSVADGGSASSSAQAASKGGDVKAFVSSNSQAFTEVENDIVSIVERVVKRVESGENVEAVAKVEANAVGQAIAEAWANVEVEITSTGPDTEACAEGQAEASAVATAFAQAFVMAAARACSGTNLCGSADGKAESIASGTATAFATAQAQACLTGEGMATAAQDTLALAIVEVYADAIVDLFAQAGNGSATAGSMSKADSNTGDGGTVEVSSQTDSAVAGNGTATAAGMGDAGTQQNSVCSAPFALCCGSTPIRRRFCRCSKPRCTLSVASREGGLVTWRLRRDIKAGTPSDPKEFKKGFQCFCRV